MRMLSETQIAYLEFATDPTPGGLSLTGCVEHEVWDLADRGLVERVPGKDGRHWQAVKPVAADVLRIARLARELEERGYGGRTAGR